MYKKIPIIFFFILIVNPTFGQDYPLGIRNIDKQNNNYYLTTNLDWKVKYATGHCEAFFQTFINGNSIISKDLGEYRNNTYSLGAFLSNKPSTIYFRAMAKDAGWIIKWLEKFRSCNRNTSTADKNSPTQNIVLCWEREEKLHDTKDKMNTYSGYEVEYWLTIKYKIVPLHTLKTSDNNSAKFLPIDVKVPLIAKEGFDNNLYHYEYATEKNPYNWRPLPARFQQKQKIEVSAEDVLGNRAKAEEMIGKHIYFRVVSYDKDNGSVCSSSEVLPLTVTEAAPSVSIRINPPLCNDQRTITATITLGRKLRGDLNQFRNNRANYIGEVLNNFSIVNNDDVLKTRSIISGGFMRNEELTEYFLQHESIENVVLSCPSATTTYRVEMVGKFYYINSNSQLSDIQLYTDDSQHKSVFTITVPKPLEATATLTHNKCFGENKGAIKVRVSGGTPPYKYVMNGGNPTIVSGNIFTIPNLASGTYTLSITDKNNCQIIKNGEVAPLVVTITQPQKPITIVNEGDYISQIRGYGRRDGRISPIIEGGTPQNGEYTVSLQTPTQTIAPDNSYREHSGRFHATFDNLDKGTYTLIIQDYNGCILKKDITMIEPPLLTTTITATPISCNQNNNDPNNHYELYNNGELRATVEGGVPPYTKYEWKKIGSSQPLQGNNTPIIRGLGKGTYQLVVTDVNENQATATYTLTEPPVLRLSVSKSEMTCSAPNDGKATAIASGGTPPYTYLWNTGHTGAHITGLTAGKYFVTVSDSRGCSIQEKVVLSYPEEVVVDNATITPITCHGGNDGKIVLTLSGGKGVVTVSWYDAEGNSISEHITNNGKTIYGLKAGRYKAIFRDQSDCPTVEQLYEVSQPEKTVINIPSQITICQGDTRSFDLSADFPSATFRWTDGTGSLLSTEPSFTISAQGEYKVEITNEKGCKDTTTFRVLQSDKILTVDFLAATNTYYNYTVKLVNLSHNITSQWILPAEVTLIKEENGDAEVRFPNEGTYTIGLKGFLDGCEKILYKTLWVEKDRLGIGRENAPKEVLIDDFRIVDNPNNGTFRIEVKLKKPSTIKIYGMDILGREVISPIQQPEGTIFNIPITDGRISAGQYLIILEAGGDVMVQKMIIVR
jgi:putative PKD domain containing protein